MTRRTSKLSKIKIASILFLLVSTFAGTAVVSSDKLNFNILEKAAPAEPCFVCSNNACIQVSSFPNCSHSLDECLGKNDTSCGNNGSSTSGWDCINKKCKVQPKNAEYQGRQGLAQCKKSCEKQVGPAYVCNEKTGNCEKKLTQEGYLQKQVCEKNCFSKTCLSSQENEVTCTGPNGNVVQQCLSGKWKVIKICNPKNKCVRRGFGEYECIAEDKICNITHDWYRCTRMNTYYQECISGILAERSCHGCRINDHGLPICNDSVVPSTPPSEACQNGLNKCDLNNTVIRVCVNKRWQTKEVCSKGKKCKKVNGAYTCVYKSNN